MHGPAIRAGLRYGLEAFALGFGLGIFRTLVVAPALGETVAVLIELPVLLSVMILRARHIVRGSPAIASRLDHLVMGATGFGLLMLCEFGLGAALGLSVRQWLTDMIRMPGGIGLAGQLLFALLPLLVRRR